MERNKETLEELKELSAYLASMKQDNVFTIPGNYFQQLHDNTVKNTVRQHVRALHEKVPEKRTHPFEIPSGYFENLSPNILNAIHKEGAEGSGIRPVKAKRYHLNKILLAAASVALILMITTLFIQQRKQLKNQDHPVSAKSETHRNPSMLENISEVDESVIIALVLEHRMQAHAEKGESISEEISPEPFNSLMEISDIDPELFDKI